MKYYKPVLTPFLLAQSTVCQNLNTLFHSVALCNILFKKRWSDLVKDYNLIVLVNTVKEYVLLWQLLWEAVGLRISLFSKETCPSLSYPLSKRIKSCLLLSVIVRNDSRPCWHPYVTLTFNSCFRNWNLSRIMILKGNPCSRLLATT